MFIFYYFRKFTLLLSVIFLVNNNKESLHLLVKYTLINMTWSKTIVAKCSAFQNKKTKALSENLKKKVA